jgi:hypothetical protein
MAPVFDVGGVVRNARERVAFFLSADRTAAELLEILRDTHRILRKLEGVVDRLDGAARDWEKRLRDLSVSPQRLDRIESAVLNIERATLGVEGAMNALPKILRQRIWPGREPPS